MGKQDVHVLSSDIFVKFGPVDYVARIVRISLPVIVSERDTHGSTDLQWGTYVLDRISTTLHGFVIDAMNLTSRLLLNQTCLLEIDEDVTTCIPMTRKAKKLSMRISSSSQEAGSQFPMSDATLPTVGYGALCRKFCLYEQLTEEFQK
ncbi:hypothetical protein [Paraburkholderia aspalathi]|uniref:Uncharacterized protein n=1 Tax=Paraburkholderia aspalathi TaxID=1324617 RepID=A0A1I7ERJ0_9BURK|nr:hypothetical protein [Paraburkholderia aspalathi]SFU26520.1 hypothetical protein SAMN05192563_105731 [Paraburkholderia aspalathi]